MSSLMFATVPRLSTPPGTKFVVTKDIKVDEDLLVLEPGVLKNLGGYVEAMVHEWKASKVSHVTALAFLSFLNWSTDKLAQK
jgi:hypothetical protein